MKLDIEKAFLTEGRSVYDYFQRPGVGFYIPLYQRDYSWDKDNVEQLLEDIEKGISNMIHEESEIRFLGTIITVLEKDKKRIQPLDIQALPTAIEKLIDGQQRMSTIALFSTQLYKHLHLIKNKVHNDSPLKDEIDEICNIWCDKLLDIFSFDLKSGKPKRKPKIIRGFLDEWTKDGEIEKKYKSGIAKYFAQFILAIENQIELPEIEKNQERYSVNTRLIDNWIKKILVIHETNDDLIPNAWEILNKDENHDFIWSYKRDLLFEIVNERQNHTNKKSESYILCSLVQLISVCHYLLERCCFTIIQPLNEDWAFDMFQSLNASGTPLTAIETFKPLINNTTELNGDNFENSDAKLSFNKIESLFKDSLNASSKSKLTNELLTSLAIVIDGSKLESHFSSQRKYLEKTYSGLNDYNEQKEIINFFGNYADFYRKIWLNYKGENNSPIEEIKSHEEAQLASLLILFLKRSNHRMSITILGTLFSNVLTGNANSISNFVESVKAISAFYILWRASDSNSKLDTCYRNFFKGKENEIDPNNWLNIKGDIDIQSLKNYFKKSVFVSRDINSKEDWVVKSLNYLKYDNSPIVRIALFLTAHDTVVDKNSPGLMKPGKKACSEYLTIARWNSIDLKDIEHIAPQKNSGTWDPNLYDIKSNLYNTIGNLTLLPSPINISAGNKGWKEKYIYYKHLSIKDQQIAQELSSKAQNEGIILNPETILILQNASYNEHILPILEIDEKSNWDQKIVELRSRRMLELVYDRIAKWLE